MHICSVLNNTRGGLQIESALNAYISRELVNKPELLPLHNDTSLLESGILDSLSLLKLVLFLEEHFGVAIGAEDLVPENFETINAICAYLRSRLSMHQVQG